MTRIIFYAVLLGILSVVGDCLYALDLSENFLEEPRRKVNYKILGGLGSIYVGTAVGIHIYQADAWWSGQRTSFHFQNDWEYALWQDKLGHMYAAYLTQHICSGWFEAAGVSPVRTLWTSALLAFAFETWIEIEDGFGPQWGFSPGDFTANTVGAFLPVVQYYAPALSYFMYKISYYPKNFGKDMGGGHKPIVSDDYEGQKYWIAPRIHPLLPASWQDDLPPWLTVAVGTSVSDLDGSGGGHRDWYLALDLDVEAIPLKGPVWNYIKRTFNKIHLPLPGVRLTRKKAFSLFCY